MSDNPKIYHGNAGAGILFYCIGTKKLLLLYRSEFVNEPHTWALVGGQVEKGEMPENAAVRESIEEIGYKPDNLIQSYIYEDGDFRFYNFISYVEDEFEPKLNWENEDFGWFSIKDIPKNIHFGLENLIKKIDLKKIEEKYMKIDNYDKSIDELNKLDIDDSFFDVSTLETGGNVNSKRVYVSIRIRYELNNERLKENNYQYIIQSFNDKPFQELSNQVLQTIRGVSTSKYNIAEWLIFRDCLIMMPFEDFVEINNAEQILYEDADYLTKNGLDIMFRIYDKKDKDDSDYEQVLGNLFPKIKLEFDLEYATSTGSKADLYAVCSNIFDVYHSGNFKQYFRNQGRVNSVKDFADIVLKYNKSGKYKEEYYYSKDFPENIDEKELENIIRRGIVNAIKIYATEAEWILKDKTLIIPNNSQLFFVEKDYPNFYDLINNYIDKYKLKSNYKINFVKYRTIEKYRNKMYDVLEKKYKESLDKGRTEVAKKIEKALAELNDDILGYINSMLEHEIDSNYSLPLKDYQDTNIIYQSIFDVPAISDIISTFKNIFLQTFSDFAKSIIEQKSKYAYVLFFETFKNKISKFRDEYSNMNTNLSYDEDIIAYDKNGSSIIYKSQIIATYFYIVNTINIYKFSDKIKEFVGSDLYRYYSEKEVYFENGGELDSKKLAIIYGLTPYNIIHAHELGGFDRSKLTIITAGLERKYLNKGDIILFTSSDTANKKEKNILLNEFLIALIPEETNSHIANILERYDILPIKYSKDDDLTSKVKRMEYLYFENGGEVALQANGDCYLVAAKLLLENDYTKKITFIGKPYLVHAEVTGQGKIDGIRYGHAWVEDDFFVYDYSNGKTFVLPKDFYYQVGEVKKEKGKYQRYSKKQATEKMLQTKHYGCWDLDTKYGHGGILLTGGLSENMTDEDIANKYNISTEELSRRIDEGMKVEKEHTNNTEAQRKIAKDHLVEDLDYYKKLKLIESDKNLETNDKVALPDCYVGYDRLKEVLEGQGIQVQKTQEEYSEGGIVVGKRHSESDENGTGERFVVESTGQLVELEGGEIVINANSMINDKLYDFEGKKMTAREIASELNHRYGGVRFNSGGKISCGCNKFYYGGELPSATLESLSGGEGVINFKTSQSKNKYKFQGRNMTPREILSKINTDNGGKKF